MKFFQNFRHDWQQNVIKRTPPLRLVKLLKKHVAALKKITQIFSEKMKTIFNHAGGNISII